MATPDAPSRILMHAGREVLRPLGLRQQGRSRVWLDDHGWWVGIVEFQPSAYAKGSFLNVGVTWCWMVNDSPHFSFSLGHRVEGHVGYVSDEQFGPEAHRLAALAAERVADLRSRLAGIGDAAAELRREAARVGVGWPLWYAAVGVGLAGRRDEAADLFAAVASSTDDRPWWLPVRQRAAHWLGLVVSDHQQFRDEVRALIVRNREALRLPPDHDAVSAL